MGNDIPTFAAAIMPRSTIKNCAKTVLKDDTNIQKEALTALTRGSTVFISYLTAYANEIALAKKRKTIMPADVLEALKVIEFERFVPEMQMLSESIDNEAKEKRERKKAEALALPEHRIGKSDDADGEEDVVTPSAKKARTLNGHAANHVNSLVNGDSTTVPDTMDEDQEEMEDDAVEDEDGEDEDIEDDEDEDEEEENQENAEDGNLETTTNGVEDVEEFENRQIDVYDEVLDNGEDSDLEGGNDQDTA